MTEPYEPEVPERSGETVAEAVEVAAAGSRHDGVLRPPEDSTPGTSPVERTGGDPEMTGGQLIGDPDDPATDPVAVPETAMPEAPVSGAAQSAPAARISDRLSAADDDTADDDTPADDTPRDD